MYTFKKIVGRNYFSDQLRKLIIHYKRIGHNMNVMRHTAYLVVNPITVNNFADLFNCAPGLRLNDGSGIKLSVKLAWWAVFGRAYRGSTVERLLRQRFRVGLLLSTRLVSSQWWILIYMFTVWIHWWVEVLHADRTNSMCIWTTAEPRVRLLQRKTGLSPHPQDSNEKVSPPHTHTRNLLLTIPKRYFCCSLF